MPEVTERPIRATGGCLCGSVRYTVRGALRDVIACHCPLCRRLHSHFAAYTECDSADIEIVGTGKLRWYRSSPVARRGFCSRCGAQLFSESSDKRRIAIAAGTIDEPTGLRLTRHVCVAKKGDYYEIADGLPQIAGRQTCE
ncbi:GFA family protein [Trinickia symbiotica]|uniref:GFA family protein n=1 Tax=Trinickia symbiotica TaxID=863227 RepID=UPI00215925D0|nr:GFA family protein [Trinickia symbiotica]